MGAAANTGHTSCAGADRDGVCDLPYLSVAQVEHGIARDYLTLQLSTDFVESCEQMLRESMSEQNESVQFLHDTLRKQLAKIEERLIDLAADGTLPRAKMKDRLNKIALDRARIQAGLRRTGDELKPDTICS